jgi:hypothetical protein
MVQQCWRVGLQIATIVLSLAVDKSVKASVLLAALTTSYMPA